LSLEVFFEKKKRYAPTVAPGINAPIHTHFFTVRLDFAVDGQKMRAYEINSFAENDLRRNPRGNSFYATETLLKTETEAARDLEFLTARSWKIASSERKNRLGQATAWKLVPGHNFKYLG
jgi:primary-amine oxidase